MKYLHRECDHMINLADGRALGYAEYGDPAGFAVFYFHGGMSSRIDATSCGPSAAAAGVRVIAPDRPGVGRSDRHKAASLLEWPADVAALADQLGIEKFAVVGWSFGGAYSAACGFALSERVTSTVLIASGIPRDWPGMIGEINQMDRTFLKLSGRGALLDEAAFIAIRTTASTSPKFFIKRTVADMSEQSQAAITRNPQEFIDATLEAFRNPDGALDDYRIWNQPWGFDVAQIAGPAHVWHGDADELCPPEWGRRLAAEIPAADFHLVAGAGHFIAHDHWADIFAAIERD